MTSPGPIRPRTPLHAVPRLEPEENLRAPVTRVIDATNLVASRVNKMDEDVLALQVAMFDVAKDVTQIKQHLMPEPPPSSLIGRPRRPEDTGVFFVEGTVARVAHEVAKLANETPGPLVQAPPEKVVDTIKTVIATQLAEREQAKELQRLREIDAATAKVKQDALDMRRTVKAGVIVGVLVAVILAVLGYAWGHAKGLVERDAQAATPRTDVQQVQK